MLSFDSMLCGAFFVVIGGRALSIAVAVISSDTEYVTRMMSYMKGSPIYHTWRLQLYTNPERIHQLAELERMELIIVEEHLHSSLLRRLQAGGGQLDELVYTSKRGAIPIIVLAAERRELLEHELYKFQSVSALLHGMQQRYERFRSGHAKKRLVADDRQQTIAFCSTLEQAGKTVMALHVAALLASKGYRVFYCNLERWNTSDSFLAGRVLQEQAASYSDLLYVVKSRQNASKWLAEHAAAVEEYSFYMLRPFQHEADRRGLTTEDAQRLVAAIAESGLFDHVLVDLPAGLDDWTLPLLQQCHAHYMLLLPQHGWQRKHQLAMSCAERHNTQALEELQHKRLLVLSEPYGSCQPGSSVSDLDSLPYVEAWQQGDPVLLGSVHYRAAVERCIQPLLTGEKVV